MSIFDIFRSGPNPNAIQQQGTKFDPLNPGNPNLQPPQNQQQNQNQNNNNQNQNQNPQNSNNNDSDNKPQEPDYSKLWQTDPTNKGPADPAEFNFKIDQNKINESFGTLDFTKAVTPELLQKIQAGGQDAISATLTAMNTIAQQAVKTAVLASSKITETGLQTTGQRMKDYVPGLVREHSVQSALREDNPLMSDPAYAPVIEAATLQFARQFPSASPAEIKVHVNKYLDGMAEKFVNHSGRQITEVPKQTSQSRVQTDWEKEPV